MSALGELDIEMQALDTLTMPGGYLHDGGNHDPPDGGSEDHPLTRQCSRRSAKKGRSRKRKSSASPSRSSTLPPRTSTLSQDNNVCEPANVAEPANIVEPVNVIDTADAINNQGVAGGNEAATHPKPVKTERGGEEDWATFARELDKNDRTMMETAKDSIDSLLVFAGLFSAVVTAFCVLSLALLQPDPTDSTAVILAQISLQLSSLSIDGGHITSIQPPYTPPAHFRASRAQITVNVLWFSSLILALIAASLGIIVKQWMREYAAPTSSQTLEHICIRQYRFDGLRRWRVDVITRMLPLLLQISLLLFFAGLSILLWTISHPVAVVGTVLVAIWLMFWLTSICLPTFYADCPYKSAESTIFFTLYEAVKPVLILGVRVLAVYLRSHVTRSTRLKKLFRNLSFIHSKSYGSWRHREKEAVHMDMARLMQRTIVCAHEISMDESMLEVATDAYMKSLDVDKRIDILPKLFSVVVDWLPDRSRRTHSLIRITLDALTASDMPLQNLESSSRTRRESLLGVIGQYFSFNGKDSQSEEVIQQLLDLPLHVDLLGASSRSLADLTEGLWCAQSKNHVVKVEAIESIAKCAMHAQDSTPEDCDDFIDNCHWLLELLGDGSRDDIISPEAGIYQNTITAVNKAVAIFKQHLNAMNIEHLLFCDAMLTTVQKKPVLKHVMRDSAMAHLQLYTRPDPDIPPLEYSSLLTAQKHWDVLNALWGLYHDCPPPPFPLIPSTVEAPESMYGTSGSESSPSPPIPPQLHPSPGMPIGDLSRRRRVPHT